MQRTKRTAPFKVNKKITRKLDYLYDNPLPRQLMGELELAY